MKLRHVFLFLAAAMLVAAGCGSDSKDDKSSDKKMSKADKAMAKDQENKDKNVKAAQKTFDKAKDDVDACRNLAMAWIAKASPASSSDPKEPAKLPEDRDKSLGKAVDTLEGCVKIDAKNRDVKQMLASTYMATNDYDKATPLLESLAKTAKAPEKPNAYYAWGLAASNAQDYDAAISAWTKFVAIAPKKDPRIDQVKQSIKALRAAKRAPSTSASGSTTKADDSAKADSASSEDK